MILIVCSKKYIWNIILFVLNVSCLKSANKFDLVLVSDHEDFLVHPTPGWSIHWPLTAVVLLGSIRVVINDMHLFSAQLEV